MSLQQSDPYTSFVVKMKAGEFPNDLLHELLGFLTGYIRTTHSTFSSEADEIASQAILDAYEHIESFRGSSLFTSWLIGIARNLIRQKAKKRGKLFTLSLEGTPEELLLDATAAARHQQEQENRQLFQWEFEAGCKQLSDVERLVFERRIQQQQPSKIVAAHIGKTDEATRQILTRACRKLRNHMVAAGWQHLASSGTREMHKASQVALVSNQRLPPIKSGTPSNRISKGDSS